MTVLKITRIPQLNSVVIKQEGGRFFISTPNSFIIDKPGFLTLIYELAMLEFVGEKELMDIVNEIRKEQDENEENSSDTSIG